MKIIYLDDEINRINNRSTLIDNYSIKKIILLPSDLGVFFTRINVKSEKYPCHNRGIILGNKLLEMGMQNFKKNKLFLLACFANQKKKEQK